MDKLQAVRFFLKLGDTLSFKGTAEHFGVPSSTVSRSIKNLESELGVVLVERTTRQVRLTETGVWYRAEVAGPIRALGVADEMVNVHAKEATGTLRLTALLGYGEVRLYSLLEQFRAAHPQIVCDVEFTDRPLDLSMGDIDIALRATADPPEYLIAKRLHAHRFVLVASPEYLDRNGTPQSVGELQEHAAIAYRGHDGVLPWLATRPNGDVVTVARRPVLTTNHGILMLRAALAGEGLAFFPLWGVEDALAEGTLVEVPLIDARMVVTSGPEMSVFLLYSPQKARLGKVRAMVDFLARELAD